MTRLNHFFLFLLLSILFSCNANKVDSFTYLKDNNQKAIDILNENSNNTLQVGDQLVISVSAKDMDVVKPFNQNFSSTEISVPSFPSSNITQVNAPVLGPSYVVDENWDIDFPVLGKINVKGKNQSFLKTYLTNKISVYVKSPIVNLRNVNFNISVIGEVIKEGRYLISDKQITILNALALANGTTMFGLKESVRILRNVDGKVEIGVVDLTKSDFISSPFYYLKQGDVVIVDANKTKKGSRNYGPETTLYVSIASVIASVLVTLIAVTANKN